MRASVLVALCPLLGSCTATLLYEPRILVSPYLAMNQVRGRVSAQSSPGGGAPVQNNTAQSMRTFGQDRHDDDVGVRADIGDGFGGLRFDYYRMDMFTSRAGILTDDWGALLQGDLVRMRVEMDEFRLGYVEPLLETKVTFREQPVSFQGAAGGVLAHRNMQLRAQTDDGVRRQSFEVDGDVIYAAVRGRASWQNIALDLDYAISPDFTLGGDFGSMQQDIEVRASYTLPMRDVTFFLGYRYSEFEATGNGGNLGYDADLKLDGYQLGVTVSF